MCERERHNERERRIDEFRAGFLNLAGERKRERYRYTDINIFIDSVNETERQKAS